MQGPSAIHFEFFFFDKASLAFATEPTDRTTSTVKPLVPGGWVLRFHNVHGERKLMYVDYLRLPGCPIFPADNIVQFIMKPVDYRVVRANCQQL